MSTPYYSCWTPNVWRSAGHVQTQIEDIFVKCVAVTAAHLQHLAILRYINNFNNNNNNNLWASNRWSDEGMRHVAGCIKLAWRATLLRLVHVTPAGLSLHVTAFDRMCPSKRWTDGRSNGQTDSPSVRLLYMYFDIFVGIWCTVLCAILYRLQARL